MDGVDFLTHEVRPLDRRLFSHKLNHAAIRYEIGMALGSSHIVWAAGGVKPGLCNDLSLARRGILKKIRALQRVAADKGYRGDERIITPYKLSPTNMAKIKSILARHEIINKRLKQFACLRNAFVHNRKKHPTCFYAVLYITELSLQIQPLHQFSW